VEIRGSTWIGGATRGEVERRRSDEPPMEPPSRPRHPRPCLRATRWAYPSPPPPLPSARGLWWSGLLHHCYKYFLQILIESKVCRIFSNRSNQMWTFFSIDLIESDIWCMYVIGVIRCMWTLFSIEGCLQHQIEFLAVCSLLFMSAAWWILYCHYVKMLYCHYLKQRIVWHASVLFGIGNKLTVIFFILRDMSSCWGSTYVYMHTRACKHQSRILVDPNQYLSILFVCSSPGY
jgi:hypothetical protein